MEEVKLGKYRHFKGNEYRSNWSGVIDGILKIL